VSNVARVLILGFMEQRQPAGTEGGIRGAFLAESLKPGAGFDGHGTRIIRGARYEVIGAAGYQPLIWTLIEFEAAAGSGDALAGELASRKVMPRNACDANFISRR
jgi:hypothetical protein